MGMYSYSTTSSEMGTYVATNLVGSIPLYYIFIVCIAIFIPAAVAIILDIIGIVYIFQVRKKFNVNHVKKVQFGVILILIGFCIQLIPVIGVAGGLLSQLGFVFLIVAIAKKKERFYLWAGLVFAGIVLLLNFTRQILETMDVERSVMFLLLISIAILGFLGGLSMFIGYLKTYVNIRNGVIRPGKKKKRVRDD